MHLNEEDDCETKNYLPLLDGTYCGDFQVCSCLKSTFLFSFYSNIKFVTERFYFQLVISNVINKVRLNF